MKKILITIVFICSLCLGHTQKRLYYPEYDIDSIKEGTYDLKSFSKDYLEGELATINPDISTLYLENNPYFLNPANSEIVLFENHDLNNLKPVGILKELTQVYLDSIIYKYRFKNSTNCVWNRIIINDKAYYTDADIHDFSIRKKLPKLNQTVLIIGQDTGYEWAYHLGYPEYFFLIFMNNKNEVISVTEVLDFTLNDEMAMEEDILRMEWNSNNNSYEITLIGHEDKIRIDWNGESFEITKM